MTAHTHIPDSVADNLIHELKKIIYIFSFGMLDGELFITHIHFQFPPPPKVIIL
jgi:hypothetical protein